MKMASRNLFNRIPRLITATVAAVLLAMVGAAAQSTFQEKYEGELFGVRRKSPLPGFLGGVAYANGTLYVAQADLGNLLAYDDDEGPGRIIELQDADGLIPNQLALVNVDVVTDGQPETKQALLVSDSGINRVMAFELDGTRLFTMMLDWASNPTSPEDYGEEIPVINNMSMTVGSKFILTPSEDGDPSLRVSGTFAAAWAVGFGQRLPGALLVYKDQDFEFDADAEQFTIETPTAELTNGGRTMEAFGVAFDAANRLFLVDSVTFTITAYAADLNPTPLFTFGNTGNGETEDFTEPFGAAFWPDPTDTVGGGRLFVADALNNRVVAYRINADVTTLTPLFSIPLSRLAGDLMAGQPYGVAVDPSTGKLAVSDDAANEAGDAFYRQWVLQTRNLVAYNLETLDENDNVVDGVCAGQPYQVRFSLTVPRGWAPVNGARPSLTVDGQLIDGSGLGAVNLVALQTQPFTYSMTAPATVGDLPVLASATTPLPTDILSVDSKIEVRDCSAPPPTVAARPSAPPQVSGVTPVLPSGHNAFQFDVYLDAQVANGDNSGITEIEYEVFGANDFGEDLEIVANVPSFPPTQTVTIPLTQLGVTTIVFRTRNTKGVWSEQQTYTIELVAIANRQNTEGETVDVDIPWREGYTYTVEGMPEGVTFYPGTHDIRGTLSFTSAGSYTVRVYESNGSTSTSWTFSWLVSNLNRPPVGVPDTYSVNEDAVLTVPALGVLANDTDLDQTPLTAVLVAGASNGTVTFSPSGGFTYTPVADFNGTDQFIYQANDGTALSSPTTVTLTVVPVNDVPTFVLTPPPAVAEDAGLQTVAGVVTSMRAGPANESAQTLTLSITGNTNTGLFSVQPTLAADGTLTYQPAPNTSGTATITVRLQDNGGGTTNFSTQTFVITVSGINDAPSFTKGADQTVAEDAAAQTVASWATAINPGAGESTQTVSFTVSNDNNGLFLTQPALAANGTLTYRPAANAFGTATVTVTAQDNGGTANGGVNTSAPQTFTITVTPVNDVPSFVLGAAPTVLEDAGAQTLTNWATAISAGPANESTQSVTFAVTNNNAALFSAQPALSANGTLTYTPAPNAFGTATVTVQLSDNGGTPGVDTSAPQTFVITVTGVNDIPTFTASPAAIAVNEDAAAQSIAGWATAMNAGPLESAQTLTFAVSNTNTALFSVQPTVAANGTLSYTIAPNVSGTATVTVLLNDNGGVLNGGVNVSTPVTFTITVNAVNDAPIAGNDSATSAGAAPIEIPVLANDTDLDGGVLSLDTFTQPTSGGVVTSSGNLLVFTPTPGFVGTVTFSYTVIDGNGGSATATVTVTVTGAVCSGPTTALVRKNVTFNTGSRLEGSVQVMTGSAVTFNGGTLTGDLLILGTPTLQMNGTPSPYGGLVVGTGASTPTGHLVTINSGVGLGRIMTRTNAVALPTVAAPPAPAGTRQVTLNNPTDPIGSFATLRDLNLNSNVGPIAVPAGTYGAFTANTNTAFVIGVAGATTPSVYNFQSLTLNSGSSLQVIGPVIVTVNNSFAPNGPVGSSAHPEWLTFRIANGGLDLNSGSSLYGYAEVPNGAVTINDTTQLVGGLAADSLTLNSNGRLLLRADCTPNQAPTVSAADRSDIRGSSVSVQISGSDQDGDALTYTATGLPPGVTMNAAGLITGTVNTSGTYTVTVTVTDAAGATGTATFTWTVVTPNQAPTAQNDSVNTVGAAPVTIPVLGNDSDPDSGTLSIVSYTIPTGGTVTTSGNQLVFTPNPGFVGTATFTYVVSDGQGGTAIGTVTVIVAAAPSCSLSGYLTYSQGGWGNSGLPGQFLAYYFADVYPAGHVTIGGSKTAKFTSASAVNNFLPQGGSPSVLTSNLVNPTSSPAGNFAAQLLALRLAVDFSAAGITKRGLGQLEMVSGPLAGQTVDQILALANTVIGGTTSALPSGMTISTLNGILDSLNLNFHEGTDNNGLLRCAGNAPTCTAVTMATTGSGSTLYGTAGNIRSFSAGDVDVKVSAFARAKSNGAWSTAYLGAWSVGMGVTDGSEGNGSGDTHKLDNVGDRVNYMLFEFSQPVVVTKAYLAYLGASSNATVWIGTKNDPYNNHLTLSDSVLSSLGTPEDSTGSGSSAQWRAFNGGATAGNVLVIAAKTSGSSDAFKVAQLEFKPCGGAPANQPPTVSAANRSDNIGATVNLQITGDDPEDSTLTYTAQGLPAGLSMTTAGKITGAPTTAGTYTVTITVTDAANATGTDTFVWTVVQPNRDPNAVADSVATNPNKTVTVNVLSNDTDADGDTLTITAVSQPSKGSTSIQSGAIKYVAPTSGTGTTTFTYTVSDGRGGVDTATVTVTLTNPAPVATNDSANVVKNGSKTITVLDNDSLFGLTGTVTIVSQPGKGSVTVNSNGTITYRASSSTGTTSFTYKVTTSAGNDTGVVNITITSSTNGSGHSSGNHGSCSH